MKAENLEFKLLDEDSYRDLYPFFQLQKSYCSEHSLQYHIIWQKDNHVRYALLEKGLLLLYFSECQYSCFMPLCHEEHLKELIDLLKEYFHEVLHQKMVMINVDAKILHRFPFLQSQFLCVEKEAFDDYLYDYASLSTLSGKKYQNKRNLLHQFMRNYSNRYEYRLLTIADLPNLLEFENEWLQQQEKLSSTLLKERGGVIRIMNHLGFLPNTIVSGVFIDQKLKAFEIATYDEQTKMIVEHVEKADYSVKGLYTFLMYKVLNSHFPSAQFVNREEDMGIESLRIAKMQLHPIGKIKKYRLEEA